MPFERGHNSHGDTLHQILLYFCAIFMQRTFLHVCFFLLLNFQMLGQVTFPVNGVHDEREGHFAFVNATIYASPAETIEGGTLIIKDGKVLAVGVGLNVPNGAVIIDCEGKSIYPTFIDLTPNWNPKEKKSNTASAKKPEGRTAINWNPTIHPEYEHQEPFPMDAKRSKDWLASGFGVLNLVHQDGLMQGTSQVVYTGIKEANEAVIRSKAVAHYSFHKGASNVPYPSSFMGAVALLRQTWYDAAWYAQSGREEEHNTSLEALSDQQNLPAIFSIRNPLALRNVANLTAEFDRPFIVRGTGLEYKLKGTEPQKLIEPLNFPKHFDVSDPLTSQYVSLEDMLEWNNAPCNLSLLIDAGHEVAITRDSIKTAADFIEHLQKAMACGLTHEQALRALTETPAKFLQMEEALGSLSTGKAASFFISNERLDHKSFSVWQHWSAGQLVLEKSGGETDILGKYSLVIDSKSYELEVSSSKKPDTFEAKIRATESDKDELKVTLTQERELITMVVRQGTEDEKKAWRLSAKISLKGSIWDGRGQDEEGNWFAWSAIKSKEELEEPKKTPKDSLSAIMAMYPQGAYGRDSIDESNTFVIVNAIVWTAADTGILKNCDIYVENGIIKKVGSDFFVADDVPRVDAKGRHVTPGIIDEHSHIGIRGGVNEGGQAVSSEVRIGDAINPWDINLFRQLAGGVTTAHQLHGSANPIGGQSSIIKLRWGRGAADMVFKEAPGFIKFALGENVKRSNSSKPGDRFPLTRMGVEQVYADAFTRAREYELRSMSIPASSGKRNDKSAVSTSSNERVDLELEALVEIMNEQRFISCHSYVQSEINMLMHIADSMNFRVNTFTHILEGYKLADKLKAHGAYASTFSDWWAYKFEVNDAIPYNAALLTKAGIITAINSDDAEMGRRLNQEAAKTMKYGGLTPEEAIRLITINPAMMLHVDEFVGSIEVGKQADLVIWSGDPLSMYAEADRTYIDGVIYFDRNWLETIQQRDEQLRAMLIAKMLAEKGSKGKTPKPDTKKLYHCDTEMTDYTRE